jgi:aryl-alcohol dehydrogenase-like predicted oxidoreductase
VQLLGQFTREYPGSERTRSNIHIATKLAAYPWRVTPGQFVSACKGSLKRLGAEQLTLGQLHWSTAKYAPLQVSQLVAAKPHVVYNLEQELTCYTTCTTNFLCLSHLCTRLP